MTLIHTYIHVPGQALGELVRALGLGLGSGEWVMVRGRGRMSTSSVAPVLDAPYYLILALHRNLDPNLDPNPNP